MRINEPHAPSNSPTQASGHVLKTMRPEIASPETLSRSCGLVAFSAFLALSNDAALGNAEAFTNKEAADGDYHVNDPHALVAEAFARGTHHYPVATRDGDGPPCAGRFLFGAVRHAGPAR